MGNSPKKNATVKKSPTKINKSLMEGKLDDDYDDMRHHEVDKNLLQSRENISKVYLFKEFLGKYLLNS